VLLPGNGTTALPQAYSFTDNQATAGTYYYQLEQVNTSGSKAYSPVVSATMEATSLKDMPASTAVSTRWCPAFVYNLQGQRQRLVNAPAGIYFDKAMKVKFLVIDCQLINSQ
jgi:hypothetical protein